MMVPQNIAAMSEERIKAASGFFIMESSAQYREFAEKCDRLVEETKDSQHKQVLQEMARTWRELADEEDAKKTR
jgi:hypothetical protein